MIQRYVLSLFCILLLLVLAYIPIIDTRAFSLFKPQQLTGMWKGQDQGTYYVRQIGNDILWMGMSPDEGKTWTNTFVGKINGDIVSGKWTDVPRGKIVQGVGTLTLKVSTEGDKYFMQKTGSTGTPFGTSTWEKRLCGLYCDPPSYYTMDKECGWGPSHISG